MAEGVPSNHNMRCRGVITCDCSEKGKLNFKPSPGRGSQRVEGYQCPKCRKIYTLTVFGDGKITCTELQKVVKQRWKRIVPPIMPPDPDLSPKTLHMKQQPVWPNGAEPDTISNIHGGFRDGEENWFPVPVGLDGIHAVKDASGKWYWLLNWREVHPESAGSR